MGDTARERPHRRRLARFRAQLRRVQLLGVQCGGAGRLRGEPCAHVADDDVGRQPAAVHEGNCRDVDRHADSVQAPERVAYRLGRPHQLPAADELRLEGAQERGIEEIIDRAADQLALALGAREPRGRRVGHDDPLAIVDQDGIRRLLDQREIPVPELLLGRSADPGRVHGAGPAGGPVPIRTGCPVLMPV